MASNEDLHKIWEWNATVPRSIPTCIHDIISKVAQEQPDEPAICAWDGELTYRELDELSTALACQLNTLGLGQGIVPLCFEKSVWMPVAMLAVFKAGGACVALDVTLPEERLRGIVKQVQPKVILSSFPNRVKASRVAGHNIPLKVVDKSSILNGNLTPTGFGTDHKPVLPAVNPSDLLYLVFTSGSTGVPKGAKLSHQNLASALHYQSEKLCFSSTSRVLDFASYAFDIAWFNFIFTLCCGGCLCIGSHEEMRNDPAACIQRYRVNFAHLTPSLTHIVSSEALSQLDILVTSGEILTASHAEKVSLPKKIINAYGPAECTPHATASVIQNDEMLHPPIGRGYGACTWVIDLTDESRLVPIGEEGELWLEGPLVGEGYLNDEEKTSSVFVIDPSWLLSGAPSKAGRHGRLYKTGDIVRQNGDGTFMFIRRKDAQVKINGQRVELGEMEYHVRRLLRGSSQLVAEVIKPQNSSSAILAIFICIDEFESKDKDALKASVATLTQGVDGLLAQVVPSYMIPSAYIPIKDIPMTATGKTDRKVLHEIGSSFTTIELAALHPTRQTEFQAPRTEAEEKMQSWWATVLGIEASDISLDDNFLYIGGDSIQAMKLVGIARQEGLVLTVADIFQQPRLFDLARLMHNFDRDSSPANEPVAPFSLLESGVDLHDARQQVASLCGLDAAQIQDIIPCTPLQEGLLAMTVKRPGDYISERSFTLRPGLDIDRFKKACEDAVANLPILRMRIFDLPGIGLVQAILDETISWESTDNEDSNAPSRSMALGDKLNRFYLSDDHSFGTVFKWKMHHALYDGWSVPLMLDVIEKAYQGEKVETVPFQRFIHYIQNIDKKAASDHWYKYYQLSQATIFPATSSPAYTPNVDEIIEHRFTNIAWTKTDITASTAIRTAWAMLQGAYTSSSDVAFGATVTGRQAAVLGIEKMAAPAIATVPVRVVWESNQTLNELLQLVQQQSIDGIPYEQIGLREIRKVSQDAEHGCNFQTLLVVQPPGLVTDQSEIFELVSEHTGALNGFNTYALQLICTLLGDGLHLSISFDSSTISRAELERIVKQFEHIVRMICDEQVRAKKMHEVNVLNNDDLQDIWNWNARLPETVDGLIHKSIEQMAIQQPNSTAIRAWDGVLTYAELDSIASRFALHLAKKGVHSNVLVPLCFEKSMWTAVAMLSVMKAGAASLLLDINQPEERLRTIIRQVNPHIILSSTGNAALATRLSDTSVEVEVISKAALDALSADSHITLQEAMRDIMASQSPLDLLYVVYTSGSTGVPKGVKISHQNFSSAVGHQQTELGFDSSSQVLDFASYAFDMAWSNFIFTLCTGGCLCIGSQGEMRDDLAGCLQRYQITFIQLTPSLARTIDSAILSHLDVLLLAGEGLSMTDVDHASVAKKLLNAYGPAECSVCGTASNLKTHTRGPPPIGRGIGQCTWVVDPEDETKLVPIGVEGELWLEGPLVGQGYLHNEEQTAAAFIQDPAWLLIGSPATPGRKGCLYKTGDLVRYTADGALIFTGRKDSQVKIRGQRIELGEVEYHIAKLLPSQYGSIQIKAEVVVPLDGNGEIMVVFVCASGIKDDATTNELKLIVQQIKREVDQHLTEILPSYMIPSAFVPIATLPLTATGKIDRKVLKRIGSEITLKTLLEFQPNSQAERKPPSTEAEEQMCNLWATVLGINPEEISTDDSFLRIGGDSIQAMRLVGIARSSGLLFSVEDVFKQPRLSDLSKVAKLSFNDMDSPCDEEVQPFSLLYPKIDVETAIQLVASLCAIQPEQVQDIFPCSPLQEGLIAMTEKQSGQYILRNEFELPTPINPSILREAFEEMATNIPILRTRVVYLPGQGFVQVIVDEPVQWTKEHSDARMGLGTRLNTTSITTKHDGTTTLTWLIHHALYDGWSFQLLLDTLEGLLSRNERNLWPLSLQPFIRHIQNIDVAASRKYWQAHFYGCEAAVFPACPSPSYVPRVDSILEHEITNLTWPSNDITPSTAIRTAWSLLQSTYTTVDDVVFGVTVAGRQAPLNGIERVAGPTIATVPVRIVLDRGLQVEEQLQKIQTQAAESMMYEHFGLQEIRKLGQEAELGCSFQALLVIQPAELNTPRNTILKTIPHRAKNELKDQADVFSTYALELIFGLDDSGVSITLNFDSTVVGAERMQRIAEQFEHFLRLLCSKDWRQTTIGDLEVACKQDLQDIWAWNSAVPDAVEMYIHDIIAETTTRQPSAPAICAWDGEMSYKELDELSTRLSKRLIQLGVGRNVPVPLLFEKSMFMPLAMLSVMKAGGCCVAMDINQPEERLRTIISQISSTLILSSAQNESMASHLSESAHIEVVSKSALEALRLGPLETAAQSPALAARPSDLLYVVFTSGSTGMPKGAQISHQNFASAIKHQSHHLGFTPESRVLDFASYAFDMAWSNFLFTLCIGGCLCIGSYNEMQNDLAGCLQRYNISFAQLTPSLARTVDVEILSALDTLILAGEGLQASDIERCAKVRNLINAYGPAECSVCATAANLRHNDSGLPIIGKGVGQCTWIVDPNNPSRLMPVGVEGELWLEGPLVGLGYLDDERTANAFVNDPPWLLNGTPGHCGRQGRLYKTGDLVRYNSDGSLIFVGRKDSQAKIRGQRLELGEVEVHIQRQLQEYRDLQVMAEIVTPRDGSNQVLIAFLTVGTEAEEGEIMGEIAKLQGALGNTIPSYMIPSAFIPQSSLPMTTTGKTDRKKLREIGGNMTIEEIFAFGQAQRQKREPCTPTEKKLQHLWAEILEISSSQIGLDDSFLRIGDSIQAIKLVRAAREEGLCITVADIFKHPQLWKLAQVATAVDCASLEDQILPFSLLNVELSEDEIRRAVAALCGIDPAQIQDVFPCTSLQEGLLALTEKEFGHYVSQNDYVLQPGTDIERFKEACETVFDAFPILRTRIVDLPGKGLVQVVIDETIQWQTNEAGSTGFGRKLTQFCLTVDEDSSVRFSWEIHHALYDGWTFPLLLNAISSAYEGKRQFSTTPFQAFIRHLQIIDRGAAHDFWQAQFKGIRSSPFPPRPSVQKPRVAAVINRDIIDIQWPETDITASTAVRAAWALVQGTCTGSSDVLFGTIALGRQLPVPGIEQIAGPTIATIPVRIALNPSVHTVGEYLHEVQQQAINSLPYEQIGLQEIRRVSQESEYACDFSTLLVIQPEGQSQLPTKLLETTSDDDAWLRNLSTYPLLIICGLQDQGVNVRLSFDSTVMGADRVQRIAEQFEHVLRLVCSKEQTQIKLDGIDLTTTQDLQDIWKWNAAVPETLDACVHDLIAETIAKHPNSLAVDAWDGTLTYQELDHFSNQVAIQLVQAGVEPNMPVPLLFEKSVWMPVSILGVMKAGATSVAMDSSQPEERLRVIIRQVQPKVILSSALNATLASQLSETEMQVHVVCKETIQLSHPTAENTSNLRALEGLGRPSYSLYIIFTSGSTGVPKGARVSHKSFASAMKHQMSVFGFNSTSRVIDFASYAFDMLWTNYLFTFYAGGCLCIRPKSELQNDLAGCLQKHQISYAFLTPSLARTVDPSVLSRLDVLAFGGEGLLLSDVTRCTGVGRIVNIYGPSECTPCSTAAVITDYTLAPQIGKGQGQCTWIVDPESGQKLVPIGVEGELWLEGPLVGDGYLDDRHTLATYEDDPVWLLRGAFGVSGRRGRLYKTGDLVRYDSDGTLIFCGRKDSQVKIRGQRVELSEVEHHARQHLLQNNEDVQIIAEIIVPKCSDNALLVMFICLPGFDMEVAADEKLKAQVSALAEPLQEQLSKKIPSYMIPSAFIPVPTMPMTGTGKTDRKVLREIAGKLTLEELAAMQPQRQKSYREPQSTSEKRLQALWSKVLGIDVSSISADDSFLRIGGDSIQAMRLVAAAREEALALTVTDIFEHPELSDLAQLMKGEDEMITTDVSPFSLLSESINRSTLTQQAASLCNVQATQIQDIFPCTPLQEGLLAMTEKHSGDYISQNVYNLQPEIDIERFKAACERVVDSLPILRTRIIDLPEEGLVQVVVDERVQWNLQQDHIGLGTKLQSFGLRHEGTVTQFTWTIHHALYDGWSFAIMLDAIQKAYDGRDDLTTVPFQRYIQYIEETDNAAATHFWQHQFEGSRPAIFPHMLSLARTPRADTLLRHEIAHLSFPKTNVTASTAIKAAWALVQGTFTNSDDVVFGTTVTGRQIPVAGVEQIAAPLIATVPVRATLDPNVQVSRLLEDMQRQSVDSIPYEHIGLQEIRKVSSEAQQGCDFQTLLVIQPSEIEQIPKTVFKPVDMDEQDSSQASAFSTYALELVCVLKQEGLALILSFDSRIVQPQEANRIVHQFEHMLRLVCAPSQQELKLDQVQIASEQDMEDIWKWNATIPPLNEMCVHNLLAQTARKQPNAPAIHAWDGQLSYGELELLSSRLAAHLMSEGVDSGVVVPLCFEKSILMPVAMLAVMKLGAASVALDINQPRNRLRSIVQQVHSKVILASATNKDIALELADQSTKVVVISTVFLNDLMEAETSQSHILEHVAILPSDLLYAVFTSGSTGLPKGVLISHQNIASTLIEDVETLGFKLGGRVLDFASYAFDMSWFNFLFTLYTGGCLCIGSQEEMHNDLAACIQKYNVSYIQLTPSLARSVDLRSLSNLDVLALAGEAVSPNDAEYFSSLDNVHVVNIYGPAECTPCSTVSLITDGNKSEPPIGRGRGLRTWVVDQETGTRLVPIGTVGELWLEGPLVGRGYLNDQDGPTSAAFIQDPTWLLQGSRSVPGRRGRLYKTRDLVRYDANGELVFIERKDSQAKIRGQRVELAEVEHHVKELLPSNEDLQVIAEVVTPRNSTSQILIAFIYLKPSSQEDTAFTTTLANLDGRLADRVPSYMIPAAFVPLTAIPMTATGKTDRKALREMGNRLAIEDIAALHVSPQTDETKMPLTAGERRLRQLWASVLNVDPTLIDANTSFLRIGDSIQAMRLVAIAREQGMLLTVADIFKQPRLCDQAKQLKWKDRSSEEEVIAPFSLLKEGITVEFAQRQAASLCNVSSSQIEDVLPCTPLQEGLLAMTQKRSGNYIAHIEFILQSDIDLERFIQACEDVSTEMPILRTRVINLPGQGLVQTIVDEPIQWQDENSLDAFSCSSASDIMELGTRLSRFGLSRDQHEILFSWTIHHALYDNFLVSMVLDAIDKTYRDEQITQYVPFRRFISHIHDTDESAATDYWKGYFVGSQAAVFPQLPQPGYAPSTDKVLYAAITNITWPNTDVTPATLIRTAWALLQGLYTSSNDVVFGCTVTGRQAAIPGAERIAGPTVATVPVRIKFPEESDITIEELQAQIQQQSIDSIPFEQMGLQNIRKINEGAEHSCDFQTLLVVQPANLDDQASIFKPLETPQAQPEVGVSSTYALEVVCDINPHGLSVKLNYDSNVIDNGKITRMQDQFEHILRTLCEEAHQKTSLRNLSLIPQSDLETVWNWNASVPETVQVCIHDIISAVAQKQPYAPAICAWDGELTYMELESLASSLSLRLITMGIGPSVIVPLCFEKSMWTAVVAYAVWKTGAACFLLDTNQPEDRLQSIIRQIRPKAILSSAANKALAYRLQEAAAGIQLLDVTRFFDDILNHGIPTNDLQLPQPVTKAKPTDLLYVVYTSGSTGTPKGATVSHQNFASAIHHQTESLGFGSTSRVLDFASYAFDMSWSCILFALCNGGCLCLGSQAEMRNDLAGCFRRYQISHVSLTPSVARTVDPMAMSGLEVLLLAGEAMSPSDVSRFKGIPKLLNAYGPSECSICATAAIVDQASSGSSVSIGKGVGQRTWVVDPSNGNYLVPIGVEGELWLEGPLVGQGYLNDEERTSAAFVHDPSWLLQGIPELGISGRRGRLYKTGDIVRYQTDGTLTFVGRKDSQAKIHGQRLELGEVEYHVQQLLPQDQDVRVVAEIINPRGGSAILAMFISMSEIDQPQARAADIASQTRQSLAKVVPSYMIPSVFIPIATIPTTVTGKIDRKTLKTIGGALTTEELAALDPKRNQEQRPPVTAAEKQMQYLWASILDVDASSIYLDDSFYTVGGDSIQAMRLVVAAREQGLSLTITDILTSSSLSELIHLESLDEEDDKSLDDDTTLLPFSLLDHGSSLAIISLLETVPKLLDPDIISFTDVYPVTTVQADFIEMAMRKNPLSCAAMYFDFSSDMTDVELVTACSILWDKFDILRAVFIRHEGAFFHVISDAIEVPVCIHPVEKDLESSQLHSRILSQPLQLGRPFTMFHIQRSAQDSVRLTIRIAHAQYDGLSLGPLLTTLSALLSHQLPPSVPQFSRYIKHIQYLEDKSFPFWQIFLEKSQPLQMPTPRNLEHSTGKALRLSRTIPAPARIDRTTSATVFIAACAHALAKFTHSTDLVFGLTVSGRSSLSAELKDVMGPCLNIIPIRAKVQQETLLKDIISQVQSQRHRSVAYEAAGSKNLLQDCTDWPPNLRRYNCIVQFQNIDESPALFSGRGPQLNIIAKPGLVQTNDIFIIAKPTKDHWSFEISGSDSYDLKQLREFLDGVCASILEI